ncbi:hypothetical protein AB0C81_18390 [Streptomyces roseoverticillatus]|uniref:hypothetical protein n=1 Tax=Streptomyces roseoverticillatus TaxID=66429 RepID=UPI0033ECA8F6
MHPDHFLSLSQSRGRRIGASTLTSLDAYLTCLLRMNITLGSGPTRARAEEAFTFITTLIDDATYDESTGTKLYELASTATGFAGWAAFDSNDSSAAQTHYRNALHLARTSGAADLEVLFAAGLARQQCGIGRPTAALELLSGVDASVRCGRNARAVAAHRAVSAQAHAMLGNEVPQDRAMDAARAALEHDEAPEALTFTSWITRSVIELELGGVLLHAGRPRQALRHFDVLDTGAYPAVEHPRDGVIHLACAAHAYLGTEDVEAAVFYAHRAQDLLDRVSSARAWRRVAGLRRAFSAHRRAPVVRDYLGRAMA